MIGSIIGAVASVGGAVAKSNASDSATAADQKGNAASILENERQFNIAQQSLAPYQAAGQTSLTAMMGMLGLQAPKSTTPYGYSVQPWQTSMSPIYKELGLGGHGNPINTPGRDSIEKWSDPLNILPGNGSWQQNTGFHPGFGALAAGGKAQGGSDGSTFVVGERGPEVLHMAPGSQGYVEPNSPKADAMAYGPPGYGRRAAGGPVAGAPASGAVTPFTNPASLTANQLMQQDPGYQFRLSQSMTALQNSSAAKGGLLSGGFGKQALQLAGGYASSEFNNTYERQYQQYSDMYNRLAAIAGVGQTSSSQLGSLGAYTGAQQGAYSSAYGQAGANGAINQGNNTAGLFNNLSSAYGNYAQNNPQQPSTPQTGGNWQGVPYQ